MGINMITKNNKNIIAYELPSGYQNKGKSIGNKIEDFEILQVMGEGSFGFVAKVKSKINNEIYALKKSDIQKMDDKSKKKLKNELYFLKFFDHPNVCRCLTSFEQDGCLYYVMKLFNNKDLYRYLNAYRQLDIFIKEENLWDIFYQCLFGLQYIHNQGVIHRDIKLGNLFMDENGNIQIGDFGISAVMTKKEAKKIAKNEEIDSLLFDRKESAGTELFMAPEIMNGLFYDQKADVFSMGICFYILCFKTVPYGNIYMFELHNDQRYSKELKEIISKMIQIDPGQRPDSCAIFKLFQTYYIKYYVKNTGIYSAIRCLFNFQNLLDHFNDSHKMGQIMPEKNDKENKEKELQPIVPIMIAIGNMINENKNIDEYIYSLRTILYEQGINKKDNIEITPSETINIIINSLNYELNEKKSKKSKKTKESNNYFHEKVSPGNEKETFKKFINKNKDTFKSIISKNFVGTLKIERTCQKCQKKFYLFKKIHYINFDINLFDNQNNNAPIDISDCFNRFNESKIYFDKKKCIVCPDCKEITDQIEKQSFYEIKKNLIIMIDRGENNNNKRKIDFEEVIKFNKPQVEKSNGKEYTLVGVISVIEFNGKKKYIAFIKKNGENSWTKYDDGKEIKNVDFNKVMNEGMVISLFYYNYEGIEKLFVSNKSSNNNVFGGINYDTNANAINNNNDNKKNNNYYNNFNNNYNNDYSNKMNNNNINNNWNNIKENANNDNNYQNYNNNNANYTINMITMLQ
jgi:NIMA (never in mitosis gene a)-related kinase